MRGLMQTTGNPLDVVIKGDGFFAVRRPGWTRNLHQSG